MFNSRCKKFRLNIAESPQIFINNDNMFKDNLEENNTQDQFNILISGYEGPIDLLLDLARKQKVNLSEISILELSEQYINFINSYQNIHLEIAADYLVMAAWLTYLKSRLLLPKEEKLEENTPEELEEALRFQLQRLESMQNLAKKIYNRPIVNRDIFYGGSNEGVKIKYDISYTSSLYDVLKTYSVILNKKDSISTLTIASSELYSVDDGIRRLKSMFGNISEWTNILNLIPKLTSNRLINKSSVTANFVASLELAKNGLIEVQQRETFGNIYIRHKS